MRLIAITLVAATAGCAAAPLDGGMDGGTPTTGIYQLTESRSGSCQPTIADDTVDAYVVADRPDAMVLLQSGSWFGPAGLGVSWIALPLQNGSFTQDLDYCGAKLHRELTIEGVSPDRVRARRVDSFSDVAAAAGGGCPPAALPAADCVQTIELDYELRQPCAKACIQSGQVVDPENPAPPLSCSC